MSAVSAPCQTPAVSTAAQKQPVKEVSAVNELPRPVAVKGIQTIDCQSSMILSHEMG